MKGTIRIVLVDPNDDSRQAVQHLLGGLGSVWLAESCTTYEATARAVAEHAPDLTLIVVDADADRAVSLIREVLALRPGAAVLPASRGRDSEVILKAIRAGAREFLTLPTGAEELLGAIDRLMPADRDLGGPGGRGAQVVTVVGASGGVGCTTLAVNLATTLAGHPGRSVALADFDLLLGSVDACLDLIPDHTLLDIARDVDRLDLTLLRRSLTRHASGLFVLPHPAAMEDAAKIDPEALRRVVGLLRATFQTVVIDASKGLQASDFVAFELADAILLVTQLDPICLRNSAQLLRLFRQFDGLDEKVRVIVNRVGAGAAEVGLKKAEEVLGCPVSWRVPDSPKVLDAARSKGITIAAEAPGCRTHKAIQEIARAYLPTPDAAAPPKRRSFRFAAMF